MFAAMTTEAKWSARVQAWRMSGLTARAFCEGKEYTASGLRYWASRLRQVQGEAGASAGSAKDSEAPQGVAPKGMRIARLVRTPVAAEPESPIVIEVGGARLGVRRGFDRGTLREVLDVLGGAR